jgi:hypothetical protein
MWKFGPQCNGGSGAFKKHLGSWGICPYEWVNTFLKEQLAILGVLLSHHVLFYMILPCVILPTIFSMFPTMRASPEAEHRLTPCVWISRTMSQNKPQELPNFRCSNIATENGVRQILCLQYSTPNQHTFCPPWCSFWKIQTDRETALLCSQGLHGCLNRAFTTWFCFDPRSLWRLWKTL